MIKLQTKRSNERISIAYTQIINENSVSIECDFSENRKD